MWWRTPPPLAGDTCPGTAVRAAEEEEEEEEGIVIESEEEVNDARFKTPPSARFSLSLLRTNLTAPGAPLNLKK